jgi:hypothetical protein
MSGQWREQGGHLHWIQDMMEYVLAYSFEIQSRVFPIVGQRTCYKFNMKLIQVAV